MTCSTPTRSPGPRPSSAARRSPTGAATPRRSPTWCAARPARRRRRRGPVARSHWRPGRPLAGRARGRPAGDPRPGRRRGAVGGGRGRRPAARRARRRAARGRAGGLPRAGAAIRSATSSRRYARTHGPFRAAEAADLVGWAWPWSPTRCAGWTAPGGWSRAAAARPERSAAGGRTSATPRCCGRCAGGRSRRCGPRSSRCRRRAVARFLPRWQGVGGGPARLAKVCCGPSSSWPAPSCPASALETLVLPAGSPTTPPAMLDELMPQRRGALARSRLAARRRRLGVAAPRRHRARSRCRRPTRRSTSARPTRRCSTRWPAAARTSSGPSPTRPPRSAPPTTTTLLEPSGTSSGPGHQRHPRATARPARRWATHIDARQGPRRGRMRGAPARSAGSGAPVDAGRRPAGTAGAARPARPPSAGGRWSLLRRRDRLDRRRPRHGRDPARPVRRRDPRGSGRRAGRAASPPFTGCWPPPRSRPGPARLLRRGAGRGPVRHRGAVDRLRVRAVRRRRAGGPDPPSSPSSPPATPPTPSAPPSPGRTDL